MKTEEGPGFQSSARGWSWEPFLRFSACNLHPFTFILFSNPWSMTLRLALTTTLVLLALGVPLAHWLNTSCWPGAGWVQMVVALPMVLPPHGDRLLPADLLRAGPSAWLALAATDGPCAEFFVPGVGDRVGLLQFALRGAAVPGGVARGAGSHAGGRRGDRRGAVADILARPPAAGPGAGCWSG